VVRGGNYKVMISRAQVMAMNKFVVENKQRIAEIHEKLQELTLSLLELNTDSIRFENYLKNLPLEEDHAKNR
jgi:uncharacterized coiled-coil protein SlyX